MKRLLKNLFLVLALLISKSIFGSVIYVDSSKATAPLKNGLTWATAFSDLNSAMTAAKDGDELWFAKGTYNGYKSTGVHDLNKSLSFFGGFKGDEEFFEDRVLGVNKTIFISKNGTLLTSLFSVSGSNLNLE